MKTHYYAPKDDLPPRPVEGAVSAGGAARLSQLASRRRTCSLIFITASRPGSISGIPTPPNSTRSGGKDTQVYSAGVRHFGLLLGLISARTRL